MSKFVVTLEALRKARACYEGYNKVVRMLQNSDFTHEDWIRISYIPFSHNQNISLLSILENNGLDDAMWALRCISDIDRDCRLFAVWCARQAPGIKDHVPSETLLSNCEAFAKGEITQIEMDAARGAAWGAAWGAASGEAWDAVSGEAWGAAWGAAQDPVWDAAWGAAWGAAQGAAWGAASGEAQGAARDAVRDAQKEMFIKMCLGTAPWQQSGITEAT